jgi:hypothetical protein
MGEERERKLARLGLALAFPESLRPSMTSQLLLFITAGPVTKPLSRTCQLLLRLQPTERSQQPCTLGQSPGPGSTGDTDKNPPTQLHVIRPGGSGIVAWGHWGEKLAVT